MYKQSEYLGCLAKTRPTYCKFEVAKCCFNCEHNLVCTAQANRKGLIKPCSEDVFEEHEICEFSA